LYGDIVKRDCTTIRKVPSNVHDPEDKLTSAEFKMRHGNEDQPFTTSTAQVEASFRASSSIGKNIRNLSRILSDKFREYRMLQTCRNISQG
jgi:hypothetical protein